MECSWISDPKCSTAPENSTICTKYDDSCFTDIDQFGITRGCVNERSSIFHSECRQNIDKCSTCSTTNDNNCNNQKIEIERCVECDSNEDKSCHDYPNVYMNKMCSDLDSKGREGCYLEQVRKLFPFSSIDRSIFIFNRLETIRKEVASEI